MVIFQKKVQHQENRNSWYGRIESHELHLIRKGNLALQGRESEPEQTALCLRESEFIF